MFKSKPRLQNLTKQVNKYFTQAYVLFANH